MPAGLDEGEVRVTEKRCCHAGDMGFLLGGVVGGTVAGMTSVSTAIRLGGIFMLAVSVLFAVRMSSYAHKKRPARGEQAKEA